MSSTPPPPHDIAPQQPVGPPTNVLAIIALVASLIGIGLAGIITGHIALGQIKRTGEQGHGMALAGLIIGYIETGVLVVAGLVFLVIFVISLAYAASQGGMLDYRPGY